MKKNQFYQITGRSFESHSYANKGLLISPIPFLTITETPSSVYFAVTDLKNKTAFAVNLRILSFESAHKVNIVRNGITTAARYFVKWLRANKINKIQFTKVSKDEVITDVYKTALNVFKNCHLI